jgi:uncharacterized C2H2 Zn-finger protein
MEIELNERLKVRAECYRPLMNSDAYAFRIYSINIKNETHRLFYISDGGIVNKIRNKIYGKYLRYTNVTQRSALAILNHAHDEGKTYRCPQCSASFCNEYNFGNHISKEHGYPKDIDLQAFMADTTVKVNVQKANPDYLKHL